jgi:mono/diheme cytochrome c family protein/nitrate/TMAO reductase-like tetraheme cytochrome c subunit
MLMNKGFIKLVAPSKLLLPYNQYLALLLAAGLLLCQNAVFAAEDAVVWRVSPRLSKQENPVPLSAISIESGKKIYNRDCQQCHGSKGIGDGEMASYLGKKVADLTSKDFLAQTDGAIFTKIRSGRAPMPGFKNSLEKEDTWHLVNLFRSEFGKNPGKATPNEPKSTNSPEAAKANAHAALYGKSEFPSAQECGVCHQQIYREWSVSRHAFAQISPTFLAYQATLVKLTKGTLGDFCERCHTEVGMTQGEPIIAPNKERSKVAMEGITCVTCHRVPEAYGKVTGRLPLEPGDIAAPIYGPRKGDELKRIFDSHKDNPPITHKEARLLEQVSQPGFCARCHDVRLVNGVRFEDLFSEFKQTPAAKKGYTCQSCHMGPKPGIASDYPDASAAIVRGESTKPARRTNHMFPGPDSSVVHPGIFPINAEAQEFASPEEWISFDVEAGWGTEAFEKNVPAHTKFPGIWSDPEERKTAREIIDKQLQLLQENRSAATELMKNGYGLGEIKVLSHDNDLEFEVDVKNLTDGHSVPSGLIAERNVFLQVSVTDADGKILFRSGDLDPNGDVRDTHSLYVHNGAVPRDEQLFNLRSPIIVGTAYGGDREQVLPANYSLNPLIFIRPSDNPSLLMGGVRDLRLQKKSIEALGSRRAHYEVDQEALSGKKPYRINVKMVAGQLPPHLIDAISGVGLEYGLTPQALGNKLVDLYRVLWEKNIDVE